MKKLSLYGILSLKGENGCKVKKAFTLVELIVAITILAILGAIGFISYTGYVADARDASRLGALENMRSALTLYRGAHSVYPKPTDSEEITYSGETIWYQGTFGDSVLNRVGGEIDMRELPIDPLTGNEYTYSTTNNKKEFQIAAVFEGEQASIINKNIAQASGGYGYTKLVGDYNGKVIKVGNCSSLKIVASPSIIKGDTDKTELKEILDEKKLVYNNGNVLPSSYADNSRFTEELPTLPIVNTTSIETFTGTCIDLNSKDKQITFAKKLREAYVNTIVGDTDILKPIMESEGNEEYIGQVEIKNNINPEIQITAKDKSEQLKCGTDNGKLLEATPTNLCINGTLRNNKVTDYGNGDAYLWICENGDDSVTCGAYHKCKVDDYWDIDDDLYIDSSYNSFCIASDNQEVSITGGYHIEKEENGYKVSSYGSSLGATGPIGLLSDEYFVVLDSKKYLLKQEDGVKVEKLTHEVTDGLHDNSFSTDDGYYILNLNSKWYNFASLSEENKIDNGTQLNDGDYIYVNGVDYSITINGNQIEFSGSNCSGYYDEISCTDNGCYWDEDIPGCL